MPIPLAQHAHVSYLELPAPDPSQSAAFYQAVFGWSVRDPHSNSPRFADTPPPLIGRFPSDLAPSTIPGIVPYIYVVGIDVAAARVSTHGGKIITPPSPEGDVWVCKFRDPAANLL